MSSSAIDSTIDSIKNAARQARDVVGGASDNTASTDPKDQSGTEPKSGAQGSGTLNSPYDQGNVPGQSGTTGENRGDEPDPNAPTTWTSIDSK